MRLLVAVLAMLPVVAAAQQDTPGKVDPTRVEVTGCVKGSTLTETNLRVSGGVARDENPVRRWRLRGPKAVMKQVKEHAGKELTLVGTTKEAISGLVIGQTRVGKTRIYVGSNIGKTAAEPLPELPTIDVESFQATGERCR